MRRLAAASPRPFHGKGYPVLSNRRAADERKQRVRLGYPASAAFSQLGNPGQGERDSGMIPNGIPGMSRTGFRDEGEHQFRDEAEQFQADPGKVFGFAGMISTGG